MGLFGVNKDMGIDLGTANTLVYLKGKGIVLREPSVVAINNKTKEVLKVGDEAKKMIGRTPGHIKAVRPMKDGVIADFDITEKMLKYFISKVCSKSAFTSPRIVICYPSGVTAVEKRAIEEAAKRAGARGVSLIEEPMAAAIGAGLPVAEATGNMVVDIGGGTTEVAVISLDGIVASQSLRIAGDELDKSIIAYIKRKYNLLIGDRTAENIKVTLGTVFDFNKLKNEFKPVELSEEESASTEENIVSDEDTMEIKGRDLLSGLPKNIQIKREEVREALYEPVMSIIDSIKSTLEDTPPELAADIMEKGITLTGGGAHLKGMSELITHETRMPVNIAENALDCVAIGAGKYIEYATFGKRR